MLLQSQNCGTLRESPIYNMYTMTTWDLLIVLHCVFFLVLLCLHANLPSRIATPTCTHANVMVVINVRVVVYWTKLWRIGLYYFFMATQSWIFGLDVDRGYKILTCFWHVNFELPLLTSLPNSKRYLIITRWMTL